MTPEEKIQSLINAADEITGQSSSDLTSAVQNLIDGYETINAEPVISYCASANAKTSIQLPSKYWFYTGQKYAHGIARTKENTDFIFNPSTANSSFRYIVKVKSNVAPPSSQYHKIIISNTNKYIPYINVNANLSVTFACVQSDGTAPEIVAQSITLNNWYYLVLYCDISIQKMYGSIYDDNCQLISRVEQSVPSLYNNTNHAMAIGGRAADYDHYLGEIDLTELYIEKDGIAEWGETNNKTETLGIPT